MSSLFDTADTFSNEYKIPISESGDERYFLPEGDGGQLIHHKRFSLSYNERTEQANWVSYELTKEMLKMPNFDRFDRFNPDYDVKTRSAAHSDYTHSGYSRGHLVPAADMSWDEQAQKESFYMSNISPQISSFNGGIWNELEQATRDWAYDNNRVYITSGPLFLNDKIKTIGKKNKIRIPSHFFKTVLDIEGSEKKGIAFIIPNDLSLNPLTHYTVSIDSVESLTKFDLYSNLLSERMEEVLESHFNTSDWRFDKKRFDKRINHWNKR